MAFQTLHLRSLVLMVAVSAGEGARMVLPLGRVMGIDGQVLGIGGHGRIVPMADHAGILGHRGLGWVLVAVTVKTDEATLGMFAGKGLGRGRQVVTADQSTEDQDKRRHRIGSHGLPLMTDLEALGSNQRIPNPGPRLRATTKAGLDVSMRWMGLSPCSRQGQPIFSGSLGASLPFTRSTALAARAQRGLSPRAWRKCSRALSSWPLASYARPRLKWGKQ